MYCFKTPDKLLNIDFTYFDITELTTPMYFYLD